VRQGLPSTSGCSRPRCKFGADIGIEQPQYAENHTRIVLVHCRVKLAMLNQPDVARDPEDRVINEQNERDVWEKMLDKTIADTFPASDPPSSIPDPDDDSFEREPDAAA
jgi:hypothetical protein